MAIGRSVVDRIQADHRHVADPDRDEPVADAEQRHEQHDRHDPGRDDPADLRADDRSGAPVATDEDGGGRDDADAVDDERDVGQVGGVIPASAGIASGFSVGQPEPGDLHGPGHEEAGDQPGRRSTIVRSAKSASRPRSRPSGNRASRTAPRMRAANDVPTDARLARTAAIGGIGPGCAVEHDRERPQVRRRGHRQAREQTMRPTIARGTPDDEHRADGQERRPEEQGPDGFLPRDRSRDEDRRGPQGHGEGDHPEDPEDGDPLGPGGARLPHHGRPLVRSQSADPDGRTASFAVAAREERIVPRSTSLRRRSANASVVRWPS